MRNIKEFENLSQYNAYTADTANFVKPNVSVCKDDLRTVYYHHRTHEPQHRNVITYAASAKLDETTEQYSFGLHVNAFNAAIVSHDFADGVGTIEFDAVVTSIGDFAFYNCDSMASVDIPNTVTSIGGFALSYCPSLTSITIPNSVTSIGGSAFEECNALTSFTCEATTPPTLEKGIFKDSSSFPIYVPSGSVDAYKDAIYWRLYDDRIQAMP